MTNIPKPPKEIEFSLLEDSNYRIVPANGMWCGITTKGDFRMDFFVESREMPESVKHRVNPEGTLGAVISQKTRGVIVRELQVGVLVSIENAESIANFIKDRIAEFRKLQQQLKKEK